MALSLKNSSVWLFDEVYQGLLDIPRASIIIRLAALVLELVDRLG
jgi:hypothetical protein